MKETFPSCPNIHHIYCNMTMQHMCSVPLFEWTRNYSTPLHHSFMTWLSLFAYWLWSCVVTVLILLTKYWLPLVVTYVKLLFENRGFPWACSTSLKHGRGISQPPRLVHLPPSFIPPPTPPPTHKIQSTVFVVGTCNSSWMSLDIIITIVCTKSTNKTYVFLAKTDNESIGTWHLIYDFG